jgi:hypothetical protein
MTTDPAMEATTNGIRTTSATMLVMVARIATTVETVVETHTTTAPQVPTAPPPTTIGVLHHDQHT